MRYESISNNKVCAKCSENIIKDVKGIINLLI